MQCFLKGKYIKSRTRWIIQKVMVFKKLIPHLATRGTYSPEIEGAMKHDVSKHWCIFQWCASRGWFIAHKNWTSWPVTSASRIIKGQQCDRRFFTMATYERCNNSIPHGLSVMVPSLITRFLLRYTMMTSSDGNISRVTGPLCGEFTDHGWIPLTKPVTGIFSVFFIHAWLNSE